jgi:hypothetical protein
LSSNNVSAEYSTNGAYLLLQTSGGQYQVWKPATQTLVCSLSTSTPGAAFSADNKYVLIPGATGVVRVDAATGATFDALSAPGLVGTPTAVSQYGSFLALSTATKVFVYNYPAMTAVASYDHNAGSSYPLTLSGTVADPVLIVGNDATGGSGGARIFDANSGTLLGTSQGFTAAIYKTTGNPQILGLSGGLTNGNKHLYATNAKPYSTSELASFFSGPTSGFTANNFAFPASVEKSGVYVGIPTRNGAQTQQMMYFVNRTTGAVASTADLGLTFSSTSGGAAVRFNPAATGFVLYGTNGGTNTYAYYYTYNAATLAVSAPIPLIGGKISSVLDGHLPSTTIAHGVVSGVPVTVDATKDTNSAVGLYRRTSSTGAGTTGFNLRPGAQTTFAGIAVSPDGTRLAIAKDTNVQLVDLSTGSVLATSAVMSPIGVSFMNNDDIYTGNTKLHYTGAAFLPSFTSATMVAPVNSASGTWQIGRDSGNSSTLIISNLAGTTNTKTFTTAPRAYGFIGDNTVWVNYNVLNAGTYDVVTEFYTTSWGAAAGQTNRTATFTRTGGTNETMGSTVGPDGKWIAAWYTGSYAPAAQGGNGNAVPIAGSLRIMSGKTGVIRATDYVAPISDGGVTAGSFAADGLHFEYATTNGNLVSTYIPAWVNSIVFSPATIRGGNNSLATMTLSHAAGAALTIPVTLTSNFTSASSSFAIAAGTSTKAVTFSTLGVAANSVETLTCLYKGETITANLTLQPAGVLSVVITPNVVVGGATSTLTVNLDGKAPPSTPVSVTLGANNAYASSSATLTVPAGAKVGTETVSTVPVAVSQMTTFTASLNATSKTGQIRVNPPSVQTFTLDTASTVGGNSLRGTITLDGPVPAGGLALTVTSANTAVVPSLSLNLPAGVTTFSFNVGTNPTLTTATDLVLTAKVLASTKVATVTVNRPDLIHFSLNKMSVVGGQSIVATIALSGDAPANLPVTVKFSNSTAFIPSSFNFTAGQSSMTFVISTNAVGSTQTVDIEVDCGGVVYKIMGVTIYPA